MAELLVGRSEPVRAAFMVGAAENLAREFGRPAVATFGDPTERAAAIRAAIGPDRYDAAAARGAELDVRSAFEEALAALD